MEQFYSYRHRERGGLILRSNSAMIPGLILVIVGALFFLNNLHILSIRTMLRYWPAVLIAVGIVKMVDSTYQGGRVFGGVIAGIGGILLARTLGYIDVGMRELWPLFLIGLGVLLLAQRSAEWYVKFPDPGAARVVGGGTIKIDTIFGGAKRVVKSQEFQRAEVLALFGGVELDLRQAGMLADSAVLEINAIFGGVEVKIPRNWNAEVHALPIFGGYADNSEQPEPGPGVKQLIVKGAAVFGGVEIKN